MDNKQIIAINNAMSFLVMAVKDSCPSKQKFAHLQLIHEEAMREAEVDDCITDHFRILAKGIAKY